MSRAKKFIRSMARRRAKGMPEVRTSDGHMVPWNRRYIVNQLLRETTLVEEFFKVPKITKDEANEISRIVEERIKNLGLSFISAPLIREMVNNVLLELSEKDPKFALYRNVCTRCGVPVYDAYETLYVRKTYEGEKIANPDLICEKIARNTIKEVILLLMPPNMADAHLKGDIHIHALEYFGLKPLYVGYDIRCFLRYGLVPDGLGRFANIAAPAKRFDVALRHASMVMSSGATHVAKSQVHIAFNVFLSPYVRGIKNEEIIQGIQSFFFEISQAYAVHGGSHDFAIIQISPDIPSALKKGKVVYKGKVVNENYESFSDECNLLFDKMIEVYLKGDAKDRPFFTPLVNIYLERENYTEELNDVLLKILNKYGIVHVDVNSVNDMLFCTHGGLFSVPIDIKDDVLVMKRGAHIISGISQVVSINLPRLVFRAKDEDKLWDQIHRAVDLAIKVFDLKEKWLKRLLDTGKLQFLAQRIGGYSLVEITKLSNIIGLIGLREGIKYFGETMYSNEGFSLVRRIVDEFKNAIREIDIDNKFNVLLTECYEEEVATRLARSDIVTPTYRYSAKKVVIGDLEETTKRLKRGIRELPIRYTSIRDIAITKSRYEEIDKELELRKMLTCKPPLIVRIKDYRENSELLKELFRQVFAKELFLHVKIVKA